METAPAAGDVTALQADSMLSLSSDNCTMSLILSSSSLTARLEDDSTNNYPNTTEYF